MTRFVTLTLVFVACLLASASSAIPIGDPVRGWTQVDFNFPGSDITSPYTGKKTGTVSFDLYLQKAPSGSYEKLTIEVDVQPPKSMVDLANEAKAKIEAEFYDATENPDGYYGFTLHSTSNGLTVAGTDASQQPDLDTPTTTNPPNDSTPNNDGSTMNLVTCSYESVK